MHPPGKSLSVCGPAVGLKQILFALGLGFTLAALAPAAQTGEALDPSSPEQPDTGTAPDPENPAKTEARSAIERFYGKATLYEDSSNPTIQKFAFSGRLQLDTYRVDSDQGDANGSAIRRLRMGFKGEAFKNWSFRLEGDFNTSGDDFFTETTDAWISYRPREGLELILGKQSAAFTLDGHTSSNRLYATERSILGNNVWFPEEYFPGAAAKVATGDWNGFLGVFSSGSANKGFGNFDGSGFVLGSLGYDFAPRSRFETGSVTGSVTADLLYQKPDQNNDWTLPNEWVGSLSLELKKDRWGFEGNFSATRGYLGQGDLTGFYVMPLVDLTKSIQFALRYSYLNSDEPQGIRMGRYGNKVIDGLGDRYQDVYAGLNVYIDDHRLKIQIGLQWTDMEDVTNSGGNYSGFGWTLALRTYW